MSRHPAVNHVRPVLHHGRALLAVLGLVVNRAHALLLMGKALLYPVGVEARFVQLRAGRAAQIVGAKLLQLVPLLLRQLVGQGLMWWSMS